MARRPAKMSPEARAWYLDEVARLAELNPEAAARVVEMFRIARQNLGDFPRMGSPGLIVGTRKLVMGRYVLTTRQRKGVVEVVAIRDGRQGDTLAPREAEAMDATHTSRP